MPPGGVAGPCPPPTVAWKPLTASLPVLKSTHPDIQSKVPRQCSASCALLRSSSTTTQWCPTSPASCPRPRPSSNLGHVGVSPRRSTSPGAPFKCWDGAGLLGNSFAALPLALAALARRLKPLKGCPANFQTRGIAKGSARSLNLESTASGTGSPNPPTPFDP